METQVNFESFMRYVAGLEYLREGDYVKARSLFADALIEEPHCMDLLLALGTAYYDAGEDPRDLELAYKYFSKVPIDHFKLTEKHVLGHTLELLGRYEESRDAYFRALVSCRDHYELNELSMIHSGLTALSERHKLKMLRPKGFRAPGKDIALYTTYEREKFYFRLRTFHKNGTSIRLITLEDDDVLDVHWSIRPRMIRAVKEHIGENWKPILVENTVWVFHYEDSGYAAHCLERVEFDSQRDKLTYPEFYHEDFEALSGYRLLWKPEHQM
jgi:tetratricopeptide (TPR) repeat protein